MAPWHGSLPGLYIGSIATPEDPPLSEAGMALVRLGPRGALLELRVMPGSYPRTSTRTVDEVVLTITEAAGLDTSQIERIEWSGFSPMPGDSTVAWRVDNGQPEVSPREIVMTLVGGRPTWVHIGGASGTDDAERTTRGQDRLSLVFFVFFVGGALVAALNIRAGRWDRRGALRLAAVAFILCFSSAIIGQHHPLSASGEVRGFFGSVAYAATRGLMTWLLYIAIEPFIRRLRPSSLVSWSRLLAGRVSDAAVGRDVLVGLALFALQGFVVVISMWVLDLKGTGIPAVSFASGENPLATAQYFASVIRLPVVTLGSNLGFLLIIVIARWMLGRFNRAAPVVLWVAIFFFTFGGYGVTGGHGVRTLAAYAAISATASTYLAIRHGLLAFATYTYVSQVSLLTVITLDPTAWYFPPTAIFILLVAALTVFGVKTSTGQKLVPSRS
jgi:hypothetical protein